MASQIFEVLEVGRRGVGTSSRGGCHLDPVYTFDLFGRPITAGSKRIMHGSKTGKPFVMPDAKGHKEWRQQLISVAFARRNELGREVILGALLLMFEFRLRRPKGHYRTGKFADQLRPSAPRFVITKPDYTKLVRAVEDAWTGVLWKDDSQVIGHLGFKRYAYLGEPEGVRVSVFDLTTVEETEYRILTGGLLYECVG